MQSWRGFWKIHLDLQHSAVQMYHLLIFTNFPVQNDVVCHYDRSELFIHTMTTSSIMKFSPSYSWRGAERGIYLQFKMILTLEEQHIQHVCLFCLFIELEKTPWCRSLWLSWSGKGRMRLCNSASLIQLSSAILVAPFPWLHTHDNARQFDLAKSFLQHISHIIHNPPNLPTHSAQQIKGCSLSAIGYSKVVYKFIYSLEFSRYFLAEWFSEYS